MSPRNLLALSSLAAAAVAVACLAEGRAWAQELPGGDRRTARETGQDDAGDQRALAEFLVGTKWLMYEIPGRIVEFGPDGKFELDDWKMQGIEARWKATGPKQVTVTVISEKFRNLTATLNFDDRLSYFTGTDLDHRRQITKSPRINKVPNDPADPYRRAAAPPRPPQAGRGSGDGFFPAPGPIADANPAVREEREILVPAGFTAARTADLLAVCDEAGPLMPVKLMVGHNMVLGTTTKLFIYPEGTKRPDAPRREQLSGGIPRKVSDHTDFAYAEPFGYLKRGQPYVVELEVTIFETDIPPQHLWGPQGPKYKVLWQTTLRQVPPEERDLPPAIQKQKAQMDAMKPQPVPMPNMPEAFLRTESEAWKRILATEITGGFSSAPVSSVVGYLSDQCHAKITVEAKDPPNGIPRSIFRGFDHKPLRAALYEIGRDTGLVAEWELQDGSPVGIVFRERPGIGE